MTDSQQYQPQEPVSGSSTMPGTELAATARPFSPGLPTGSGLGKYRILERIRTYHNAVAYKARDAMLDRLVTIKQMAPDLIDNPVACGNFKREAQFLARVSFDTRFVVNIHELIEDEIGLFIVEEFVEAQWLESLIFKRRIGPREAPRLLRTAAQGLQLLHRHSIVHRDVHPGNILVGSGGVAKIANLASSAHESDTSRPPVITPKYAAPELLLEGKYDDRVDVYGLGMTLLEVCVGRRALNKFFADILVDDSKAVGRWIDWQLSLDKRVPSARSINPMVQPRLSDIIERMTAKRLEDRFTSIDEVIETLNASNSTTTARGKAPFVASRAPAAPSRPRKINASQRYASPPQRGFVPPSPTGWTPPRAAGGTTTSSTTASTTAKPVRPPSPEPQIAAEAPRPAAPSSTFAAQPQRRSRYRGRARAAAAPRPAIRIDTLPTTPEVSESFKRKYPRIIRGFLAASLLLGLVGYSAQFVWKEYLVGGFKNPTQFIFNLGEQAYRLGRYDEAQIRFNELVDMKLFEPNDIGLQRLAGGWSEIIEARKEVVKSRYDNADKHLAAAMKLGIASYEIADVQTLMLNRKEAELLVAEGMEALAHENFTAAERAFNQYERKAIAGGVDPSQLKEALDSAKRDYRYRKYIKESRKALSQDEFQTAFNACSQAESINHTSETRDLRRQITDAKNRYEWVLIGDDALTSRDFEQAISSYEQASNLAPSPDVELKLKNARANLFLEQANKSIAQGDLLGGEDKLKNSLYNAPIEETRTRLERLSPSFDAARLAQKGDLAMSMKDFKEAERLYRAALPQLPGQARKAVEDKINEALRAAAIERGDQAFFRGELTSALDEYDAARAIRADKDVDEKISRVKSQIP
jgi:serine/threonine protein kinase/tetratricopeptide (TPR) repeat protein